MPGIEDARIVLKWGTWKEMNLTTPELDKLGKEYDEISRIPGVMTRYDTTRQKEILCEIIDIIDKPVREDTSDEIMSVEEAKKYIMTHSPATDIKPEKDEITLETYQKDPSSFIEKAINKEDVVIALPNGQKRVLVNINEYKRLREHDTRKAYGPEDVVPDDIIDMLEDESSRLSNMGVQ